MRQIEYNTPALEYHQTREQWLDRAKQLLADNLTPLAERLNGTTIRVACGWPSKSALRSAKQRLGECWYAGSSADHKSHNIFISPSLDSVPVILATLTHELAHVAAGSKAGHGPAFKRIARACGLTGKMTATVAGAELRKRVNSLAPLLGPYPHASIDSSQRQKQGTRMLKVICPDCGYTVRTTQQWLEHGLPTCPCGAEMQQAQ
jgi:hypothetical protein